MKKPDGITNEIVEWISEEIIGSEQEMTGVETEYGNLWEDMKRQIRNELRREQERRLRDG